MNSDDLWVALPLKTVWLIEVFGGLWCSFEEGDNMGLSRKLGIAIVCGIPAIVGSGLFWALSEKWILVFGYLSLLGIMLLVFMFTPQRMFSQSQIWEPALGQIKDLGPKLKKLFSGA